MSIFSIQTATYQKLVSHNLVSICPNLAKKSHGGGAVRHFTYRAVQTIKQVLLPTDQTSRSRTYTFSEKTTEKDDHTNCPQTNYKKAHAKVYNNGGKSDREKNTGRTFHSRHFWSQKTDSRRTYSDAVTDGPTRYRFRGENMFNHLNC